MFEILAREKFYAEHLVYLSDTYFFSVITNINIVQVRRLSYRELDIFRKRWEKAVNEDECWVDPFPPSSE